MPSTHSYASFDPPDFLERVGDDASLAGELISLLQRDLPSMCATLQAALRDQDAAAVERSAHALKGAVANFGAAGAVTQAQAIETMGRRGSLGDAEPAWRRLEPVLQQLLRELGQFAADIKP